MMTLNFITAGLARLAPEINDFLFMKRGKQHLEARNKSRPPAKAGPGLTVAGPFELSGRQLVAAMCAGQAGNLLPHVVVPAIMAEHLIPLWGLTAAQAGLMAGAYAFGYMLAVPVLATLTDRIDARRVLLAGSTLSGLGTAAFGSFADGLWSASAIWALAGIGFAGAYMPGLKALTDRLPAKESSRSITLYTGSFSIGVGLSFLVSQLVAARYGWRMAFFVTALGPLVMIAASLAMPQFRPAPAQGHLLD